MLPVIFSSDWTDFLRLEGQLKVTRKIGFCQKTGPCCRPELKNRKAGEMTTKLGGVKADDEIYGFDPAVNSNIESRECGSNQISYLVYVV